jgi:hypothetical protein
LPLRDTLVEPVIPLVDEHTEIAVLRLVRVMLHTKTSSRGGVVMMKNENANPTWWTSKHASAWERVKAAFARDWDQTKHDFSKRHGHDLDQNVGDTVKQAAGKEYEPPPNEPNPKPLFTDELEKRAKEEAKQAKKAAKAEEKALKREAKDAEKEAKTYASDEAEYRDIEPALRYGYGAALQHTAFNDWDPHLEAKLRDDWNNLDHGRSWEEVKAHVRTGWNRARSAS